ncbi:Glycosyltransferase WbpH [uncultured Sphingopyxis sp.]|uniref:Glycosyltransferase WbpH n=2 Tax=uncultured Sphingopyxis sp. TaxID=310581 RepID=A0A1Y5PZ38_9SPHN|nr:Glycosyltransferase WbpH [uncultured Sphingopyxis sp.]
MCDDIPQHIAHLTSVHSRYDTRIFRKLCNSLADAGYAVSLVVADGKGDERCSNGVRIVDAGRSTGRLRRMIEATRRVGARARELNADLYHLHDPELMPLGLALKRRGKRVVFDFHEDVPKQLLSKPYLNPWMLHVISAIFARYEKRAAGKLDAVIGATPIITEKFRGKAKRLANINNFPRLGELESTLPSGEKANEVAYVGGISETRGILPLVRSLERTKSDVRLNLAGKFESSSFEQVLKSSEGWQSVNELGFLDREGVRDLLSRSILGVVTLLPTPAYLDALPVKMFEYMSAGIPVIASDFPLWREIIVGHDCGLCVDPEDPDAIAAAIDALVSDRERAEQMGRNGRRAVHEIFNWSIEERKLLQLYTDILA